MKRHVVFAVAILAMLIILAACGRNATPTEPVEEVPTYSHVNLLSVQAIGTLGEVGQVTANQANGGDWHTVTLSQSYTSPVVVMQPLSFNGSHPSVVRLKNVTGDSFEFQIDEWDYLDGGHTAEELSYLVLEAGQHTLESGLVLEAGTTTLNQSWQTVSLSQTFANTPVVFTQAQTNNDPSAVTTRQRNATSSSFQVRLQEEQANDDVHADETVGYIALTTGSGVLDGKGYEVNVTPDVVTHKKWTSITFERSYTTPIFLAHMQTFGGSDPAALRYRNLGESSVQVFVEEEKSADSEIGHTSEVVSYAVFEAGFAFGETEAPTSTGGGDAPTRLEGDPNAPAVEARDYVDYVPLAYPDDYAIEEATGLLVSINTMGVAFKVGVTVAEVNIILSDIRAEILGVLPTRGGRLILTVRVPTQTHKEIIALAESLEERPEVDFAIEVVDPTASQSTNTNVASIGGQPSLNSQAISYPAIQPQWSWEVEPEGGNYGLELSKVPQMWNLNANIEQKEAYTSTLIAELGIAENHPDLQLTDLRSDVFKSGETTFEKDHGTMVSGIVGAEFNNFRGIDGVTPFPTLLLDSSGFFTYRFPPDLLSENPGLRVINISADIEEVSEERATKLGEIFAESLRRLSEDPATLPLIVVAAGNASPSGGALVEARTVGSWQNAALEQGMSNMIVVEGIDVNKKRYANLANGSNIGGHVSAPATDVGSIGFSKDYLVDSGTSLAAPYVTGLASYLFSLDPTLTTLEVCSLIIDNAVADVEAGMSPRIDAFASAIAIDKLRGNNEVRKMLLDIDDGTEDGNQRVLIGAEGLSGTQDSDNDGKVDGASEHTYANSKRLQYTSTDFIHDSGNEFGPIGDGKVDMSDFRRWRDWLLQAEGSAKLDGSAEHPKKDLNLDGVVEEAAKENVYPRGDFNGDGILSRDARAKVPGFEDEVTDLEVLQSLFDDRLYEADELPGLVDSADLYIFPTECISGLAGYPSRFLRIMSYITVKGEDGNTGPSKILSQQLSDFPQILEPPSSPSTSGGGTVQSNIHFQQEPYSPAEAVRHRIYTLPVNAQGYTANFTFIGEDRYIVGKAERDFTVSPGQDILWDPQCIAQPEFNKTSVSFSSHNGDDFGKTGITITNNSEEAYFHYSLRGERFRENHLSDTSLFFSHHGSNIPVPPGETLELKGEYDCWYTGTGTFDESLYVLSLGKYKPEDPEAILNISAACTLPEPPMPEWEAGKGNPTNSRELSRWLNWCDFGSVRPAVYRADPIYGFDVYVRHTNYYVGVFVGENNFYTNRPKPYNGHYSVYPIESGNLEQHFAEATDHWVAFTNTVTDAVCNEVAARP